MSLVQSTQTQSAQISLGVQEPTQPTEKKISTNPLSGKKVTYRTDNTSTTVAGITTVAMFGAFIAGVALALASSHLSTIGLYTMGAATGGFILTAGAYYGLTVRDMIQTEDLKKTLNSVDNWENVTNALDQNNGSKTVADRAKKHYHYTVIINKNNNGEIEFIRK